MAAYQTIFNGENPLFQPRQEPVGVTPDENEKTYIGAFYTHTRAGRYSVSGQEITHPKTIDPQSWWHKIQKPMVETADWSTRDVEVSGQKVETIMGYSKTYRIGFVYLDLRDVPALQQKTIMPADEQFDALDSYMASRGSQTGVPSRERVVATVISSSRFSETLQRVASVMKRPFRK